ncbi:MAG: hypothetical protein GQF41_0222 [Candidatus Rifleibacterium amylolyticum]|nr:MAG: hypothetical protein GQF41_0222 [Candidatus Rifleibacterium amylolyticum]
MNAGMRIPSMVVINATAVIQTITPKMFCLLMIPTFHCYLDCQRQCLSKCRAILKARFCAVNKY